MTPIHQTIAEMSDFRPQSSFLTDGRAPYARYEHQLAGRVWSIVAHLEQEGDTSVPERFQPLEWRSSSPNLRGEANAVPL
jgi:hypothetical protein